MRSRDRRVVDAHRHRAHRQPRAHGADHHLGLEGEAVGAAAERERRGDGVHAEARLRVLERLAARDLHPAVGEAIPERPDRREAARLVLARAHHQRARLRRGGRDEPRDVLGQVLPVAVERDHVRHAFPTQGLHARRAARRPCRGSPAGAAPRRRRPWRRRRCGRSSRRPPRARAARNGASPAPRPGWWPRSRERGSAQRARPRREPCPTIRSCQTRWPMERPSPLAKLAGALHVDGVWLRRLAYLGSAHAPEWFKRSAPHLVAALAFALAKERRRARGRQHGARARHRPLHGALGGAAHVLRVRVLHERDDGGLLGARRAHADRPAARGRRASTRSRRAAAPSW